MKKILLNKSGYSVIISLLLIGFILVLSIGIFRLILNEMKNNRALGDYIKSYAGAESAQELALLEIKKYGYGYNGEIESNVNDKSVLLTKNNLDKSKYHPITDVLISYSNDGRVNSFEGVLDPLGYNIIPLFYIDSSGEKKVNNININISSGNQNNFSWNIVGKFSGIGGKGLPLVGVEKKLSHLGEFEYSEKNVSDFIPTSSTNYLVLFNSGNSESITYNLSSVNTSEYFTKPLLTILSTGEVGDYKQNLRTKINNTELLNMLKYSIFSN